MTQYRSPALDFIVFGSPRGGTSATMRLLNINPDIYCAMEVFRQDADYTKVVYPDTFRDQLASRLQKVSSTKHLTTPLVNLRGQLAQLARRPSVPFVGNKRPLYFMVLDEVLPHIRNERLILCLRDPIAVGRSWTARTLPGSPAPWSPARIGLFGILEIPILLAAVAAWTTKPVMVVPHKALLVDEMAVSERLWRFVGSHRTDIDPIERNLHREISNMSLSAPKAPIDQSLRRAANVIKSDRIAHLFDRDVPYLLGNHLPEIAAYILSLNPNYLRRTETLMAYQDNPHAETFAKGWIRRATKAWEHHRAGLVARFGPATRSRSGAGRS